MIRDVNKGLGMPTLGLVLQYMNKNMVQIEMHQRICCKSKDRNLGTNPGQAPVKAHVWAGISHCGCTNLCIFEGKMNAPLFISILRKSLVPLILAAYPDGIPSCWTMTLNIVQS